MFNTFDKFLGILLLLLVAILCYVSSLSWGLEPLAQGVIIGALLLVGLLMYLGLE